MEFGPHDLFIEFVIFSKSQCWFIFNIH